MSAVPVFAARNYLYMQAVFRYSASAAAAAGFEIERGAYVDGLTWHYARPPVIDLEFEMDVRATARDIVLA